jgi:hypothetical protein
MLLPSPAASVIDMPGWRPIVKQVVTTMVTVSLLPMAVFYTAMSLFGLRTAALATVLLYYAGLILRYTRGKPVLAAALLTAGLLSLRTVVMFFTGSAVLYFLQPVAGTVAVGTVIAATALAGRPVLDRLAHEFCPLPRDMSERLRKTRFFSRISVVWSVTYLINAAGTVWLLTNASLGGFLVLKSVLSPLITISAVAASYGIFRATVRNENVRIRWAHHQPWKGAMVVGAA